MSSTTFVDQTSIIYASWLNDVNTVTYTTVPSLSSTVAAIPSTYLTQANAASTYLTQANATTTYGKLATTNTWALAQTFTSGIVGNVTGNVSGTAASITGVNPVATGGTGLTTLTANNVILGNGTSTPSFVAPSTSGNVLTSNGTTWSSTALPASGGMTLLGTVTTTSGASQTLSSLTLTGYKQIQLIFNNVSGTNTSTYYNVAGIRFTVAHTGAGDSVWGTATIDLTNGAFSCATGQTTTTAGTASAVVTGYAGNVGITTATTSIVFAPSAGTFDSGTILVYGVK
jgi:hypothetical protein